MNVDADDSQVKKIRDSVFFSLSFLFCGPHFFYLVKIDPPDDQNQDVLFLALHMDEKSQVEHVSL